MRQIKNIVWDWNGTLLNDVNVGLNTLNRMLEKRELQLLTLQNYRDTFGFPVINFYKTVGFDLEKESLHEVSVDFVDTYEIYAGNIGLTEGIRTTLRQLQEMGFKQYILSALREDLLKQMIQDFGIGHYFEQLCGSDNIYAAGKVERGKRMVDMYGLCFSETLMIGDTIHDAEVAEALGFEVLLYAGGHNSCQRLREKGKVIMTMNEIPEILQSVSLRINKL